MQHLNPLPKSDFVNTRSVVDTSSFKPRCRCQKSLQAQSSRSFATSVFYPDLGKADHLIFERFISVVATNYPAMGGFLPRTPGVLDSTPLLFLQHD